MFRSQKFRSHPLLSCVLASILWVCAGQADAHRPGRRSAAPAAPPPGTAAADEAFLQARHFAQQSDLARFDATAARAAATAPSTLRPYLAYWRLKIRIGLLRAPAASASEDSPDTSPAFSTLESDIADFLAHQDDTLVADLLRRDWLLALGRRGLWAAFDAHHAKWVLRDDTHVHCYEGLGRVQRGQPLPTSAREALMQPREISDACFALIETLARNGGFRQADVWRRLELALEANALGSVRRLGPVAGMTVGAVEAALQRPAKVLGPGTDREVAVIALAQIARQDPQDAASHTDAIRALPAAERAFVWSLIASQAMRRLAPRALEWTREATGATASDETLAWMARAALRGSDWKTLHAVIDRMSPEGRRDPAWMYWQARAHAALGRPKDAQEQLRALAGQFNFYGQLATEELGEQISIPVPAGTSTDADILLAADNPGFARALRLYELGLRAEGNREWYYQVRTMNDRQLLAAAQWACRGGVLDRCVNTADRTQREHDFSLRFVSPMRTLMTPLTQARGLDPAWVYGLIRQESRFIMDVRSSAGAQGLMQIIPPTARWIAGKLGVRDFRIEQLNDPDTNLRFGTFYMKSVLDDLEGSPLLASAAYNAGPNRPRTWRATLPGEVEGAVFAEIIPFNETRDYVKKVLSNTTYYGALFSGKPQSLKAWLGNVAPKPPRPSELP